MTEPALSGTVDLTRHAAPWSLDPATTFLNHGSFGATPTSVLEAQTRVRAALEAQPVRFFLREAPALFERARDAVAGFVGADPADVVRVRNATEGVNAVLRSLPLSAGDELLTTSHAYNACRNALEYVAARAGAQVRVVTLPFPVGDAQELTDPILDAVTDRTRLALLDHVTSPTALVMPLDRLVPELEARGVETLIDGAHAPGMLDVDLTALGATYYTANMHKWPCAPKGAAFLWVRRDRHAQVRPVVISHGANAPAGGKSRLHEEFDWTGTDDPSAWLCVPDALEAMDAMLPGGWSALRARNHALALEARRVLCDALGTAPAAPAASIGSLAAVLLPGEVPSAERNALDTDPLQDALLFEDGIEVPIVAWPPGRRVRVSAQLYNDVAQYERLAEALVRRLALGD